MVLTNIGSRPKIMWLWWQLAKALVETSRSTGGIWSQDMCCEPRYNTFATCGRWLLALVIAGQADKVGIPRFCLERFVID
jgi:hypothetical protein